MKSVRMNLRMKCICHSSCESFRCRCRRNGSLCTSSCHPGNAYCNNKERENSKEIELSQDISVSALNNGIISKIEIEKFVPRETFKFSLPKLVWAERCAKNVFSEQMRKKYLRVSWFTFLNQLICLGALFLSFQLQLRLEKALVRNDEGKASQSTYGANWFCWGINTRMSPVHDQRGKYLLYWKKSIVKELRCASWILYWG